MNRLFFSIVILALAFAMPKEQPVLNKQLPVAIEVESPSSSLELSKYICEQLASSQYRIISLSERKSLLDQWVEKLKEKMSNSKDPVNPRDFERLFYDDSRPFSQTLVFKFDFSVDSLSSQMIWDSASIKWLPLPYNPRNKYPLYSLTKQQLTSLKPSEVISRLLDSVRLPAKRTQ